MGTMKFEVPHSLPKDEAKRRVDALLRYWGGKYGTQAAWQGDGAQVSGKVMGIHLDAAFRVTDSGIQGEGTDPGLLLRGQAKSYLTKKFAAVLDPRKSLADLQGELE